MRAGAVVGLGLLVLGGVTARAGEIHRWVDENGVVHFADVPPPNVQTTTRNMPNRPTMAPTESGPAVTPAPGTPGGTPGTPAASKGPARVAITEQNSESLGGSRHAISGTVANQGGEAARDVVVQVQVVSPAQGDDCLTDEIDVSPSTLKPGEKGEFDTELDHPCFRGETQISLRVQWE
jgi:hypothetical protein